MTSSSINRMRHALCAFRTGDVKRRGRRSEFSTEERGMGLLGSSPA